MILINDNNENEIQIHYIHKDGSVSEEGWPEGPGDRISKDDWVVTIFCDGDIY